MKYLFIFIVSISLIGCSTFTKRDSDDNSAASIMKKTSESCFYLDDIKLSVGDIYVEAKCK